MVTVAVDSPAIFFHVEEIILLLPIDLLYVSFPRSHQPLLILVRISPTQEICKMEGSTATPTIA